MLIKNKLLQKLIFGLLFCTSIQAKPDTIPVVNGKIDLTHVNLNHPIELKGNWDFYWQQFILPAQLDSAEQAKKLNVKHPGPWTKVQLSETQNCPAQGYATYRLRIKVPNKTQVYALKIHSIFTAYKIFINNTFVDGLGQIGKTKDSSIPQFQSKEIPIPVSYKDSCQTQELDLVLQVSNFHHRRAGLQQVIEFGKMDAVISQTQKTLVINLLLIGIILIIGLNHILMYALRRMDISNLIFGLLSMIMILRNISTGERIIIDFLPNLSWEMLVRLDNFSGFGTITVFSFYFFMSFKKDFPRVMFYLIMGVGILITGLVFFTKTWFYGQFRMIFEMYIGLGGLYLVFGVLLPAVFRKRPGGFITFLGMFLLYATAVNDVLVSMGVLNGTYIAPYGIAAFMILQSYLLTRKSAHALKDNQKLSAELKLEKVKLEERIQERTSELSKQTEELGKFQKVQERQNWINESLNHVNEIMRDNKDNLDLLADQLLAALIKRVDAIIGDMYFLVKTSEGDKLKLLAQFGLSAEAQISYLDINEGLVGKCFGTAKEEYFRELPKSYFTISSGLGSALPNALAIFPMVIDQKVIGVVEIATFKVLSDTHKDFIRKALANIAAQLNIVKLNTDNQRVLEEYKGYKEELERLSNDYLNLQEEYLELKENRFSSKSN